MSIEEAVKEFIQSLDEKDRELAERIIEFFVKNFDLDFIDGTGVRKRAVPS